MSVDRLMLQDREMTFNKYKKRPFKERYDFVNSRISTLMQDSEKGKLIPSQKLFTKFVGPKVQCMSSPNSAVMLDSNDFYHYAMTRLSEIHESYDFDYNGVAFAAYMTRIANDYFGKLPTDAEYKAFTQGKVRSIEDFKGSNKASAYERALVINNFAQILGFESNLVLTDKGPAVMLDYDMVYNNKLDKMENGYLIFFPGNFTYARKGKDVQTIPAMTGIAGSRIDYFLHSTDREFEMCDFTKPENVEGHIPGYKFDNPEKLNFKLNSLGLTSLQSKFENKVNTREPAQERTR